MTRQRGKKKIDLFAYQIRTQSGYHGVGVGGPGGPPTPTPIFFRGRGGTRPPYNYWPNSRTPHGCPQKLGHPPVDPRPSRGPLFFSAYPTLPHVRHGAFFPNALQIWPQKGPFGPFLAVKFVPWQAMAPARSVSCAPAWAGRSLAPESTPCGKVSLGQTAHWHSEYTLQKGHTDRHIALRAV